MLILCYNFLLKQMLRKWSNVVIIYECLLFLSNMNKKIQICKLPVPCRSSMWDYWCTFQVVQCIIVTLNFNSISKHSVKMEWIKPIPYNSGIQKNCQSGYRTCYCVLVRRGTGRDTVGSERRRGRNRTSLLRMSIHQMAAPYSGS